MADTLWGIVRLIPPYSKSAHPRKRLAQVFRRHFDRQISPIHIESVEGRLLHDSGWILCYGLPETTYQFGLKGPMNSHSVFLRCSKLS